MGERTRYEPGTFCRVGLATPIRRVLRARSFYGDLLGWEYDLSPGGYAMILNAGVRTGDPRVLRAREGAGSDP